MNIRKRRFTLALAAALLCLPSIAAGQPPKIESRESIMGKLNPMNWSAPTVKMPSMNLLPTSQKTTPAKSKQPGFWSNLGSSTRSAWRRTADVLNPFDDGTKKAKGKRKPSKSKKSTGGFFSQWTKPKEEPKTVSTVGDFLQQPFPY
ncbi:MAG: hypothetical protein R3C05_23440 [Pirellulaceae bacterium]